MHSWSNALFVKALLDSFLWLLPVLYFHYIRSMTHFLFLFGLYWTLPAAFYMQRRFRAIHKKSHIKNCQYNKKAFTYFILFHCTSPDSFLFHTYTIQSQSQFNLNKIYFYSNVWRSFSYSVVLITILFFYKLLLFFLSDNYLIQLPCSSKQGMFFLCFI